MRTRTYSVIWAALAIVPALSQAEFRPVADHELAEVSGQSGLMIEIGAGTISYTNVTEVIDWSDAGVQIDATKWVWDLEEYNSETNVHTDTATSQFGGVVNMGVKVAGRVDLGIDGVANPAGEAGGIALSFSNSWLNTRTDASAFYLQDGFVGPSMGATELLGIRVDGLDLTLSGR